MPNGKYQLWSIDIKISGKSKPKNKDFDLYLEGRHVASHEFPQSFLEPASDVEARENFQCQIAQRCTEAVKKES